MMSGQSLMKVAVITLSLVVVGCIMASPTRGAGRVLAQFSGGSSFSNPGRVPFTCSANPGVCTAGTACCQNLCVDVGSDVTNCGRCGRWCGYGQSCCGGSCVSILFDANNCGGCNNRCNSGARCTYGMCNYA